MRTAVAGSSDFRAQRLSGDRRIPNDTDPGAQLVEGLRSGDRRALEALYRAHQPGLQAFVARMIGGRAAAEEIVHDIFIAMWRSREGLRLQGTLKSYLYAAARNRALNHLKRRRVANRWWERESQRAATEVPREPETDAAALGELEAAVEEAVGGLPERTRLVFTLSRYEGLTYSEIADALEISVKTVEAQMSRALRLLRSALAPFVDDHGTR